jgi:hypothetical protein
MADSSVQEFPGYIQRTSSKPRLLIIFVVLLIIAIAALVGLYLLGSKTKKLTTFISSVPNQSPTPSTGSPTPSVTASISAVLSITGSLTPTGKVTPTPAKGKLDRSSLSVAVLNGSGIPGAAGKISSQLTSLGYKIASTGNADVFTYKGLTVKVKKVESSYLGQLEKDLSSQSASVSGSVDDTISSDAEVIVGK